MYAPQNMLRKQSGVGMVEVLVTLVILLVGLLGLAGLQMQAQRSEMESYQRVQALTLLQDMAGRISANRGVASCYAFTTNTANGTPYLGATATAVPACPGNVQAVQDMNEWSNLLKGAAEGGNVGGMIGGRGCVSYNAGAEIIAISGVPVSGTGIYTLTVAWQGLGDTVAPTVNCANAQYANGAQRRVVSIPLRIASLINP